MKSNIKVEMQFQPHYNFSIRNSQIKFQGNQSQRYLVLAVLDIVMEHSHNSVKISLESFNRKLFHITNGLCV